MSLEIVVITGMSGSGKSLALRALEDSGYYCVDNLPPELLASFVALEHSHRSQRVAVAMDVRSATALPLVPQQLNRLRETGVQVRSLFLDASTGTLVRRFSETRRRHPLSQNELPETRLALVQTIELERQLLAELREQSYVIDTSVLRPAQLLTYVKELLAVKPGQLTLVFESFAFKHGVPFDSDYVFDVRMLPNPHYEPTLRALTGRDAPVIEYLRQQPEVERMQSDISQFLEHWLDALAQNHRSYVTVAIGCTGGQHRSVYLAEQLSAQFASHWSTLCRHRELDGIRHGTT
ncbi:MAG TPA: RNase adapter RapZ [Alicycliphilus sp.]|nr:RNase adapter RapZ [Alicycliphilus sp.]HRM92467.1 RNase adapter RapZ [Alicycliphilus sp.]HRN63458.1 RNase adapter RapZ [Alicycliphilus sp.]